MSQSPQAGSMSAPLHRLLSQAADADYVPASSATAVVNAGGLGRFSMVDFRKKMTGIQTSVSPFISQYDEGLSGT